MNLVRWIGFGVAKTLSKVFGLATMTFFGRMPSSHDGLLAGVGLLALTWVPVVAAIAVPSLAELMIPFAPEDEQVQRTIAIVAAIAIPFTVGGLVAWLHHKVGGNGAGVVDVLHGLWYTPVIGLTVSAVVVVVPLLKAERLVRRFEVQRLMVLIERDRFDDVVDHVVATLERRGLTARREAPNPLMAWLFRRLVVVLGHIFGREVSREMVVIRGHDREDDPFEITLHATDLTILGPKRAACRVYAVLAEELDERELWFTWDEGSRAIEVATREHRARLEDGEEVDLDAVRQLAEDLAALELDPEEWNNVRRLLFRLERDTYARAAGADDPEPQVHAVQEDRRTSGSGSDR
ncbi:MAG: hypothetical protein JJT89_01865 [Nitriliruptoraceae bacterium]|nr:hypothetical protein [Nitriliruptoraceae bacterium]